MPIFYGVFESGFPVGVGGAMTRNLSCPAIVSWEWPSCRRLSVGRAGAAFTTPAQGLVERNRVEGCEDAYAGDYRSVVVVPAVAFRRDVHYEADVEVRLVFYDSLRVFRDFVVQAFRGVPAGEHRAVELAERHALSASHAFAVVDFRLPLVVESGLRRGRSGTRIRRIRCTCLR